MRLAANRRLLSSRQSSESHDSASESVDLAPSWCRSLNPFVKNARRCGCKEGPTPPIKGGACCSMVAYRDGEDCNGNGECVGFTPGHEDREALKVKANKYIGEFLEIEEYQSPRQGDRLALLDAVGNARDTERRNSVGEANGFPNAAYFEERNNVGTQDRNRAHRPADTADVTGDVDDDDNTNVDADERGGLGAQRVAIDANKHDNEDVEGMLEEKPTPAVAKQPAVSGTASSLGLNARGHVPTFPPLESRYSVPAPSPALFRKKQPMRMESHEDRFDGLSALALSVSPPRTDLTPVPDAERLMEAVHRPSFNKPLSTYVHRAAVSPNSKVVSSDGHAAKKRRLFEGGGITHESGSILSPTSLPHVVIGRRTGVGTAQPVTRPSVHKVTRRPPQVGTSAASNIAKPSASRMFDLLNLSAVTSPELRRLANHSQASILCARPGSILFANYSHSVDATRRRLHPKSHAFASDHEEGFHNLRHYGRANCVGIQDTETFVDRLFHAIVNWTAPLRKWVLPPLSKSSNRQRNASYIGQKSSSREDPSGQDYLASVETAVLSLLQIQAQEHQAHVLSRLRNHKPVAPRTFDDESLKERLQVFLQTSAASGDAGQGSYVGYGQTSNFLKHYIVFTEVSFVKCPSLIAVAH